MDVGTTLRAARERRNLSIDRIAAATKIAPAILHAIERNDFDRIPGGLFTRGYIRAYAREVGLDGEALVAQLGASSEPSQPPPPTPRDIRPPAGALGDRAGPEASLWAYVLGLVAALVLVVIYLRPDEATPVATVEEASLEAPQPPAEDVPVSAIAVEAVVDRAIPVGGETATARRATLRVDIETTGPCWVEAVADGRRAIYRLMQAGERAAVEGRTVTLRVGDPGTFRYAVNGLPGTPLGAPGVPVTVHLTPDEPPGAIG